MIIARLWTLPTAAFLAFVPMTVNAAVISPSQNLVVALDSALNTKNIGAISNLLTSDYTHGDSPCCFGVRSETAYSTTCKRGRYRGLSTEIRR